MYVKLYSSIVTSSIWSEDAATCKTWITLLALADRQGYVFGSPAGIARIAALGVDTVQGILTRFASPDPQSADLERNPEQEGRRIQAVPGGWKVLNYEHYRDMRDADVRRESVRNAVRKHRNTLKAAVSPSEAEASSESDTESVPEGERRLFAPPTLTEAKAYFESEHLNGVAEEFFYHHEANGWVRGRTKMKSWKAAARTWSLRQAEFGRPQKAGHAGTLPSGDFRLPTGGFAAADRSWFDYNGSRYFQVKPWVYRDPEGYAPDGSHKQNTPYTDAAKEIADRILAPVPVKP